MNACICFRIEAPESARELLFGELYSQGILGIEETDAELRVYFSLEGLDVSRVLALADGRAGIRVHGPERVEPTDWAARWREGLEPRRVGSLWIRPSWCARQGTPEIVIDPEQAFGSGEHASTRLALKLLLGSIRPGDSVLDCGSGSGILALAARRLGAGWVCGLDIDRDACRNARRNSERNGLAFGLLCGSLEAIHADARFHVVVVNLLLGRLCPWFSRLDAHATRVLVISGYTHGERETVHACLRARARSIVNELAESQSGDLWCASLWSQNRDRQSSSKSSSVSSKR